LLDKFDRVFQTRSGLISAIVLTAGFVWRLWLAQATFFNTDEAWHFYLGDQSSAWLAYKASLTISHPPLLILILHFWRALGTSNLVLRLPAVIAGVVFCWIFYRWLNAVAGRAAAWAGLILSTFLGPMIVTSAEVRQNPFLLVFAISAAWLLEVALAQESGVAMWASCVCLSLAMLSHYAAFFIAAALGVYSVVRILQRRPSAPVLLSWLAGETIGVAVGGLLYKSHLGRLSSLLSQPLLPQQYLYTSYFHKGTDHLLPFLYRGTFGIFRFVFGQTRIGQLAVILFAAGVVLALLRKDSPSDRGKGTALGILLVLPFALNWLAAAAGIYPFGRMRQCMFLAIFALAGVSICLGRLAKERTVVAVATAIVLVVLCQAFGTQQDRDALPLADQRHHHMDHALQFLHDQVAPQDVIFTDQATSFQLRHYLCQQRPVSVNTISDGLDTFACEGFKVVITGVGDGALTPEGVAARWRNHAAPFEPAAGSRVWVAQGGWASGLGESLQRLPGFAQIDVHSFGRYLEVFTLPPPASRPTQG
jgi:hypothetical protein